VSYVFLSPCYDLPVEVAGLFSVSTLKQKTTVKRRIYTLNCEVL